MDMELVGKLMQGSVYAQSLFISADLSECSVETAIGQLIEMKKQVDTKLIYLVCTARDSLIATKVAKEYYLPESDIVIVVRIVEYLGLDAWFVTDGQYLVFSPGA